MSILSMRRAHAAVRRAARPAAAQVALALLSLGAAAGSAQTPALASRLAALGNGTAEVRFAARPGVCGDGRGSLRWQDGDRMSFGTNRAGDDRTEYDCVEGPVRVLVSTTGGVVTRLRTIVGGRADAGRTDLGIVSVREADAWLEAIIGGATDNERVASDAVLAYVLADSTVPWPLLVRVARDDRRAKAVRSAAAFWLSQGAATAAGVRHREDRDDVRASAVFAISQQEHEVAVPRLLELARSSTHPDVRAQAMFWLGQSGDRRAIDYFAEVLGVR